MFDFNFDFQPLVFASIALWSLALYLALTTVTDWLMAQLVRWFNFAERSLYTSAEEYEKTRPAREAQNSFYASILSIIPFFFLGALSHYLVDLLLGDSWALSLGILSAIGCGIYELGRRTGQADSGD
ncbi:hypothetical protein IQ266_00120 [filamentous cyanobacterium LEGE 11480]|uniref:Uncharacterized protein n=1 Tax=Romeriopsis navalis LEGE 11480 TaxID=2777977 RepID=A0A928Z2I6_9CYAN|nr:hypothetical protein [Romeriopsis navalis LEGE 11480]